ncbi:aspartate aminotransferase, cytoplasmic-like isoform X2 [Limulus polyphemus]|uniref:Aspartate aminotransferase n=1 Tax=Limulus polyphemus TaxID=6850 RepID=A0ABM1SP15_LIMPO|nr:aspartate aminotransferase, cytoplasmic-like isoform X2 [Limulus polyphemus]
MSSRFSCVEAAPPVEIFALSRSYKEDQFPQKVDLGIGAYRTNEGKPWVLPVVRKVEQQIATDVTLNHEYLSQLGYEEFSKSATKMLLGNDSPALTEGRGFGVQCLSGTGSLRVGAEFLINCAKFKTYYMSSPTWPNHRLVFKNAGFQDGKLYRYWDASNRKLDLDGMLEDLKNAPEDSVIILHACAHNPTGIDPTKDQWKQIADIMEQRKLFPFFDCAYQGFASGNLENDSWAVRYFVSRGFELLCAQSFAKNFGLYNERIGNLTLVFKDSSPVVNVRAQITLLVRGNYSNPPVHGARIVSKVLNDATLYEEWQGHIKEMSGRIKEMRQALRNKLEELGTPGTWEHITNQIGMFSYTGLNQECVNRALNLYSFYICRS